MKEQSKVTAEGEERSGCLASLEAIQLIELLPESCQGAIGCVLLIIALPILGLLLAFMGLFKQSPRALPSPNAQCEFTALMGDNCKIFFSRKKDRIRMEPLVPGAPPSGKGQEAVCIGTLKNADSEWLIFLPDQHAYFRWSAARATPQTPVGSRLSEAVSQGRYLAPGGSLLSELPTMLHRLTSFDPKVEHKPLPNAPRYQLVDTPQGAYAPYLGVIYSQLHSLNEAPIDAAVFEIPNGCQELFPADDAAAKDGGLPKAKK